MLNDLLVQLFDAQPRTETSVYMLLIGKKTLSVLFAALQHDQLNWLQLYPTLSRGDFQAAIDGLVAAGALQRVEGGTVLGNAGGALAQARLPLPTHFNAWMDLPGFWPRFLLAVQSLSETSFHDRRFRPATPDWAAQQAVRAWWHTITPDVAIAALTQLFEQLPEGAGDLLAQQLIGHEFVGSGVTADLAGHFAFLEALAQLVVLLDAKREDPWARLWGGRKPLGSPSQYQALQLAQAGVSREQIAQRLRLRPSTVNEHLLGAAIFGAPLPLASVYPTAMQAAFSALPQTPYTDFHELLAKVSGSDFFQVRLYEILLKQGRWPHGSAS